MTAKPSYPTSVPGQAAPAVATGVLDRAGDLVPASVPGSDKTVFGGITSVGGVLFGAPPTADLTTTAINALTTTQIAALTSAVVLTDVAVTALTTTAISGAVAGSYYDAIVALTTTQLQALSTTQLAALTTTQIAALTAAQSLGQIPSTVGAIQKPELPVTNMLAVAPGAGQTVTVATRNS